MPTSLTTRSLLLALVLPLLSCGALRSLAEFDPSVSGVRVDSSVAPADGETQVHVTVQLRYAAAAPVQGASLSLVATGAGAKLAATTGKTDSNGLFTTTLTGATPGVVRLAANIQGQSTTAALQTSVQFVSIASGASLTTSLQATVGIPDAATVTILDKTGQRVPYYDGTVEFTSSDPLAVLPAPYQFTSADQGQHSFDGVTFNTAGMQSLVTQDAADANITARVDGIKVYIKTAPMLEVSGVADALAGTVSQVKVRAVDISRTTQTDYVGTVHFSSSDPLAALPADTTFTVVDAGVKALPITLKTAGLQSVSAVDVNNVLISGLQDTINVWVQADRFSIASRGPAVAGAQLVAKVRAVDAYGNTDPSYIGPAIFASNDVRALLPTPYSFTPADAGAHDANVIFYTSGHKTLSAQGTSASFSGTTDVLVAGAPVQRLALLAPQQVVAGTLMTLVATAYDLYGNVSSGYSGLLTLSSSDANATLPGPVNVTAATSGSVVITAVTLQAVGVQVISVYDANLALSANATISVVNAPAASFALSNLHTAAAGSTQSVTVAALDVFGNPAVDYTGSVVVTSDDARAQLPSVTTFTLVDAGIRALTPVVFKTAGMRQASVADVGNTNIRGREPNIWVLPLAASSVVVSTAAQAAVGLAQNVVVRAVDIYGNTDPNFAGTVTLTSSDVGATLPQAYTFAAADAGRITLSATFYASGSQTLSAQSGSLASSPALISVASSNVNKLGVSGLVGGRAGRPQNLVIQALDAFNNLVPGYVGSVQLVSSDSNAILPSVVTFAAADGGQKLATVTLLTAGLQSVAAHDVSIPSIAGSQGNILIIAIADRLRVQAPSVVTAGGNFALSVTGVDAWNNVDAIYTGTIALATSSSASTLPTSLTIAAGAQGAVSLSSAALLGAGSNLSITAQDTQEPLSGIRSGMRVLPATAASLVVQAPSLAFVGSPFDALLTAYDTFGNQATGYTGRVTLNSSDSGAGLGGITTFVAGGQGSATAAGLQWSVADSNATLTATDTQNGNITGTQSGIVVRAGGAVKLRIAGATSGLAGHTDSVIVTALDNSNNIATAYTGTVRFASTDGRAMLPSGYTFLGSDAGTHTFSVTWTSAGTQRLTAQDTSFGALVANQDSLVITARSASALRLSDTGAAAVIAGASRSLRLAAVDGFGNVDSSYAGSVSFSSSDPLASLPGPVTPVAGIANVTFAWGTSGSQSLTATDNSSPALVGNLTQSGIQPGPVTALMVSGMADAPAGTTNSATIAAVDGFGNPVPTYLGTVHLSSSDSAAILSGDVTFRTQDAGSRVLPVTLFTGGAQSLTATDVQTNSIQGTQNNIRVRVHATRLKLSAPSNVTASNGFNITVAAVDAYGNADANYLGSVSLTSSDAQALFGAASSAGPGSAAALSFSSGDAGQKTLSGTTLFTVTSAASISATDNAQSLSGQRSGIAVAPGAATHLAVTSPASVSPGSPFSVQISALDAANNLATQYTGSIALHSSDSGASLPTSVSLIAADLGVVRLSNVSLTTAGLQTITANDTGGIAGSASTTVAALAPVALRVTGATSGIAGHSDSVTVIAVDAYSNPADGNIGVVTLSSSDAAATLPGPFAVGSAQTHTFVGVQLATAGNQTLRATALPPAGAVLVGQQSGIIIAGAAATQLSIRMLQDAAAGQAQNITIAATDAYGNVDPNFAGSISLTSSDANASLPNAVTLTAGSATVNITLTTAGAQSISAASASLSGISPSVTVWPGAAQMLALSTATSVTAGQSSNVTVTASDAYGNLATDYVGSITLSSSDPVAALPAALMFAASDAGSKTAAIALFTPGTQSISAHDTARSSPAGQQMGIVVSSGQRFMLSGPTSIGAGQLMSVTVQAVDGSNNVDTSFTGTVHFLSTDARAVLPADVNFTGSDAGQKTITGFRLLTAGSQAGIMATTLPAGRAGALYPVTVNIAAAMRYTVAAPLSVAAGSNFNVILSATDSYGNPVSGYTGTARLSSSDPQSSLPASVTFAAGNAGVVTFAASLRTAVTASSIAAVDSFNAGFFGQGNITVTPLSIPSSLAMTGLASSTAGHPSTVTVTALDVYGNAVPQYRGTVSWSSSDTLASLPGRYSFVAADRGAHTFAGISLATVGNQTVTAADVSRSAAQAASIAPAAASFFVINANSLIISGQAQNVLVAATDPYGNVDTSYTGTIAITSSDVLAVLPPSYTFTALDAGRHSFSITLQDAGTQSVTASDSTSGIAGTQGSIIIVPGATSRLSFSGPTQVNTGAAASYVIRALDPAGNLTPAYLGTVRLLSSDALATLPANLSFTSSAGGQRAASLSFATAGNQSITATDIANSGITGNLAGVQIVASAVRLQLALAANTIAGSNSALAVRVMDNFNNTAIGYTGTLLLSSSDSRASYPASVSFTSSDLGAKNIAGTFKTSGNQSIAVADSLGVLTSASISVSVAAAATDHYDVAAPANVAAGGNIALALTARDAFGNATPSYSGTAAFTSSDVSASLPASVGFNSGTAAAVARATHASLGTGFTATDVAHPSITGTSLGITVTPLAASAFAVTGATSGVAGHAQSVTVSARDIYSNLAPSYRGIVALNSSDAQASLPASYGFMANDAGSHTFGLTLLTAGSQMLIAADTTQPSIDGAQNNIVITAAPAVALTIAAPATSVAGNVITASVAAVDTYGNLDGSFRGSVALTSSDTQASLPGAYLYTAADAGNHNLPLTLATAGTRTLSAQSTGLSAGVAQIAVVPAATTRLAVSGLVVMPAGVIQSVNVRAADNFNNTTPAYRGSVTFASSDARTNLPGNYTFLSGDAGSKSWPAAFFTHGPQQIRVADSLNANIVGAQNTFVTVQQTQLALALDSNITAGVAFNVTLTATDAYGNINPNYTGTVHFTTSDANATLPPDVTFAPSDQGIVVLTRWTTLRTSGVLQSLTATDSANGFVGTQAGIIVNSGPAAYLSLSLPARVTAGAPFSVGATAFDAYNNLATTYTGRVSFSSNDTNANLPPTGTFTLANQGTKTFAASTRLYHAGPQLLTATDSNNLISGTAAAMVQSAAASSLTLTAPAAATAGVPVALSVAAYDAYGNLATGMTDTVVITGSDAAGSYPGSYTFSLADGGNRILGTTTTLRTAAVTSLNVSDTTMPGVTPTTAYVVVAPASVASITINAPAVVTAATNFAATVVAVDAYLNIVNTYTANVQLTSTDAAGMPSSSVALGVTFSTGTAAQRSVSNLHLSTAGPQLLSAVDPNNNALYGSTPVQVNPGPALALAVTTSPNVVAGQAADVTVQALDAGSNIAPSFVGSVSFGSTDPSASLPASTSFAAADAGQKTLSSNVIWRRAGMQTLIAASGGLIPGSTNVQVNSAAVAGLQLYGIASLLAGATNQSTLRATDAFGNTAPQYTGSVAWSSSDAAALLPGATTFAAGDAGLKTVSLRLYTAGAQSVTVTDGSNGFAATQNNIIVNVQRSRFVVSSPNAVVAGVPFNIMVAATDAYSNLDTNFVGALHFTSSDANAGFPASAAIAGSDHGQRNIGGLVLTSATPSSTIAVLDNTNTVVGLSPLIAVSPANANRLSVSATASVPAGHPLTATITAFDAFGNLATGYAGSVQLATNNANAVLPPPLSFAGSANATVATSNIYLLAATNNSILAAADIANINITGTQQGIQVTPLGADHFKVGGLTSGAAGHPGTLNVVTRDIYNNIATSYRGTVGLSSSDPGAGLPDNYSFVAADQGSHNFSPVSLATVGTQSVTVRDAAQSSIQGTQSGIVIAGNNASRLTLTGGTSTIAGQAQNILVAAVDAYGNIDTNFTGTVNFSSSDVAAAPLASYAFVASDAGTHLVSVTYATSGTQTLTATGPAAVGSIQTSTSVVPSNANALVLSGIPNVPAGQATSVTVRVIDAYNNTVPLYRGQVHFTTSNANAAPYLPADYTFVAADNGTRALGLTLLTAGTQWVQATDTSNSSISGRQSGIIVGVAQSHLMVSCNTNVVAGVGFNVTATAVDAYGNINTGYTGRVHLSSGDAQAYLPGDVNVVAASNGGVTFANVILRTATANQSIIATDTNVASYTGAQSGIAVNAASASRLALPGPSTTTAGVIFSATLTAYDAFSNVATSYRGTATFSSSDPGAGLPPNAVFAASNNGMVSLSNLLSLSRAGSQSIIAQDANSGLSASLNTVVSAAAAGALVLTAPSTTTAGSAFAASVQAQDAFGNVAPTYRGTVSFSSGDPCASYPPAYTFLAADAGGKTFSTGLGFKLAGTQILNVTDVNNTGVGVGASLISVNPAALTKFRITAPSGVTSEASFVASFAGLDNFNNIVNTYTGTTLLTSSDPNGTPSPGAALSFSFNSGAAVQRSVSGLLLNTGGNQTLYARDANNSNALFGQATVLVTSLPATNLALSGFTTPITAGQTGNIVVQAYDNYGNIATGYAGTIQFTSSDPNANVGTLSAYTFSPAVDRGAHAFAGLSLRTTGTTQSITATDTNGVFGTQRPIIVTAASPNSIVLTLPLAATAGTVFSTTVTAYDGYGNIATGYNDTVSFLSSTNPNASLPATYSFVAGYSNDAGQHVFNANTTLYLSGNQNITATDTHSRSSTTNTSITAANANILLWTAPSSTTAGTPLVTTLAAYDRYGNLATSYRSSVAITSSDGAAALPGPYAFSASDSGRHVFNGSIVLKTSGTKTVSATDTNTSNYVVPAMTSILVNANATTAFTIGLPVTVQPTQPYSATVTSRDAYGNATPLYASLVNLTSTDPNGTPSVTTPLSLNFSGSSNGAISIGNLRLKTLGSQTLTANDVNQASVQGSAATSVQAQNFTAMFSPNTLTASTYNFDTNFIAVNQSGATLAPTFTTVGDNNSLAFAAGNKTNLTYDAGGYLRIDNPNSTLPFMFYSGLDLLDTQLTWTNTVDTSNGNVANVGGFCCGISGPETNSNSTITYQTNALASALLYSGNALGGNTTAAYTRAWSLQGSNLVIDANSVFSYWVFPQSTFGANGNPNVSGSNSAYVALNVVFSDGSDTRNAAIVDGNNIGFNPSSQGTGGKVVPNQWNYVRVKLNSLAGKTVDRIDVGWQKDGATGGYRGFIDKIILTGHSNQAYPGAAMLDASWTPAWSSLAAYWPMDGVGQIADNQSLAGIAGGSLQAHNANGAGFSFVNGVVGQAVYVDGYDDYLSCSGLQLTGGNYTIMAWTKYLGPNGDCWVNFGGVCGGTNNLWVSSTDRTGMGNPSLPQYNVQPGQGFPSDTWSHLAVVFNGNFIAVFRDGVRVASGSANFSAPNSINSNSYIGLQNASSIGQSDKLIDEFAVWNTALDANQINAVYQRQSAAFTGTYTSHIYSSPINTSAMAGFSWSSNLPSSKPIVSSNQSSESNLVYPSLGQSVLNSNLSMLWHLDEAAFSTVVNGDFNDWSGNGNPGLHINNDFGVTPNAFGRFGRGVSGFYNAWIASTKRIQSPSSVTLSLWFQYAGNNGGGALMQFDAAQGGSPTCDLTLYIGADGRPRFAVNGGSSYVTGSAPVNDRRWHHVAASLSSAGQQLYLDGKLVDSNNLISSSSSFSGYWLVGAMNGACYNVSVPSYTWTGQIDEVAVWNRGLSASEVKQLYRRGSNRLMFQVRQCTSASCSDDSNNTNWKGPDGTSSSYFSEMGYGAADLSQGLSPLNVYGTAAPTLSAANGSPYVQYRGVLQSDDATLQCLYGGQQAPCSPEVISTAIYRTNYTTTRPSITLASGAAPYYSLASFSQTLGAAGCTGGVAYTLSPDGNRHFYYDGANWLSANGAAAQSTASALLTPSVVNAWSALSGSQSQTFFRAFLASDGNQACSLQSIGFSGAQ